MRLHGVPRPVIKVAYFGCKMQNAKSVGCLPPPLLGALANYPYEKARVFKTSFGGLSTAGRFGQYALLGAETVLL